MIGLFLHQTLVMTTPILLAALGGLVNRQGGIVNVGLDGMILPGALAAVTASAFSGSCVVGGIAAAVTGGVVGLGMALVVTRLSGNEIIVGLGFNLLSRATCRLILRTAFSVSGLLILPNTPRLPTLPLPAVGAVGPFDVLAWLLVPSIAWFLRQHYLGLRLRAAGAAPQAARALGFDPMRMREVSTVLAGALAGLAGADLALGIVGAFGGNMAAGRGFTALAAFYIGGSWPGPTALACLGITALGEVAIRAQDFGIPVSLAQSIPYLLVVAALPFRTLGGNIVRRHRS